MLGFFFFLSKLQKTQGAKMYKSHWIYEKEEAHYVII